MSTRATIEPPVLDGYEHVELLGSGGFADVFLYEQEFPRRRVAIKFLVGDSVGNEPRLHGGMRHLAVIGLHRRVPCPASRELRQTVRLQPDS